jgi:hypothetical protein
MVETRLDLAESSSGTGAVTTRILIIDSDSLGLEVRDTRASGKVGADAAFSSRDVCGRSSRFPRIGTRKGIYLWLELWVSSPSLLEISQML